MARAHEDGHPDFCADDCDGPHYEDNAPEVCPECGGSGRACYYGCVEGQRVAFEPFEGSTGAHQAYDYEDSLF